MPEAAWVVAVPSLMQVQEAWAVEALVAPTQQVEVCQER